MGVQGSNRRERSWEACSEHHLMVGNSSLTPNMSYSFKPLWLFRCLPFLISLKCSSLILYPGRPDPVPYSPLSFSSPENYIKCHPLHKHSRVSLGLPSAPMVLYAHLPQLSHTVLWLLNIPVLPTSSQLVDWAPEDSEIPSARWHSLLSGSQSLQESGKDQTPRLGKSLCSSTRST